MPKIVLVEDDPMISEIYERKFREEGFDISSVASGEQVLELAKKEHIDLILTDLLMPKMDGFELIKQLRGGGYDPDIRIIVSSNLSEIEDHKKAFRLGANGFVVKSEYTPGELVEEIKNILHEFKELKKNTHRIENGIQKNGKRVLMMEDEAIFAEMFGEKLTLDGFDVELAATGHESIKKSKEGHYDAFIVDMVMPGMTGDEIIAQLLADEDTKNVPIIAYTASDVDEIIKKVKALGIKEVYTKTQLVPSKLAMKVREACGIEEE